ncbi:gliding motility-associated C-terminal domain-containing protein [Flavobacteriales bacterium]|nr:gliding motility-associated C-terminal domain-containing protein [Flavobacteriales bacterium]
MRGLAVIFFIFFTWICDAQQLFWNQAQVLVSDAALLHVNGNIESSGVNTILENRGDIVARNGTQNGNFVLNNRAFVNGNGIYSIEGDWINNADFISDSSQVVLQGDNEFITGDSISKYYDLELSGTGIKTQQIDAYVAHRLQLNDRELAIDSFAMTITNPAPNAVLNDTTFLSEGFASTLNEGRLIRTMNRDTVYLFPMGSSASALRYRAVEVEPATVMGHVFAIGFNNFNATIDGFPISNHDSTICKINDLFYHNIDLLSGTTPVNLKMFYRPTEGSFNQISQWQDAPLSRWDTIGNDLQTQLDYATIEINGVTDFIPNSFSLALLTPNAPTIIGDTLVCEPEIIWSYQAEPENTGSIYYWEIPIDGVITAGSGTSMIDVDWLTSAGGPISVYEVDTNGCQSFSGITQVNLFPGLSASFDTVGNPLYGVFEFENYSIGADVYYWDFGDGTFSTEENPIHTYSIPGLYEVQLTVENSYGCTSISTILLEVDEGINIPNVFTPNGDGNNDTFYANSIGIMDKSVLIMNRWGKEVFYSTKLDFAWDGTNIWNGEPVSEGTYFYIITAESATKSYRFNGALMLHR